MSGIQQGHRHGFMCGVSIGISIGMGSEGTSARSRTCERGSMRSDQLAASSSKLTVSNSESPYC